MKKVSIIIIRLSAKIASSLFAVFMLIMFIGDCFEAINRPPPSKNGPRSVKVNQQLILANANAEGNWNSSNTAVATVKNGVVTGLKTGETVVTHFSDNGVKTYNIDIYPSTLHDAYLLGLMALLWIGFLAVWWRERAASMLTIAALLVLIVSVSLLNGIPLGRLAAFMVAGLPALALIIISYRKKNKPRR